jgi:UDPglucose 6-dehydrogenase
MHNARLVLNDVAFFEDPYQTIEGCDALMVVTEWDEFRNIDMGRVKSLLKNPIIVDGRNIYTPEQMRALGFTYLGVGR